MFTVPADFGNFLRADSTASIGSNGFHRAGSTGFNGFNRAGSTGFSGFHRAGSTGFDGFSRAGSTGFNRAGSTGFDGFIGGAREVPATPSLALPIPGPLASIEGLKKVPVTSLQELFTDVESFFTHLNNNCPFFHADQQGKNSLAHINSCLSGLFDGPAAVSDPDHIDYLSKALQYLRHSSFSSPLGFGILQSSSNPIVAEYARCFQSRESHATRAAAVVEHMVQQSRYFYQVLAREDYLRLHAALLRYLADSGPINQAMQGSPNATAEAKDAARILTTVLQDPRMPGIQGPFTLYRGIGSVFWTDGAPQSVCTPFIHSTSTDPESIRKFASKAQWIIHVPAGQEAKTIAMTQFVARPENEFIMGPVVLEKTRQLSAGGAAEAPAYEYQYRGPVTNARMPICSQRW